MMKLLMRSMTELGSRKWISRLTGRLAQSSVSQVFIRSFARIYRIQVQEAEKPISEYRSLNEFFTRRLKPGARLIDNDPATLVCPVDALITGAGPVKSGTIFNIKGQDYAIEELLGCSPRAAKYAEGFYLVLYLSPTDYHRIHVPVDGTIVERVHFQGKVYPVNEFGLRHMKMVLSRNERLTTYIRYSDGEVAVIKVGAMNVSSIKYVNPLAKDVKKGQELAYFEFGSTVVLLTENHTFTLRKDLIPGMKVHMGESLGTLRLPIS
ncbi:archaetidylserine decarboxylase [Paenibacillus sp. FSL W8-0186]|uniref:Phosphatidylserine decarboxylase proenzyme n=1 Tax=Paenibacillus woosongensis TaxID=307580 RepID=A0ABQ4MT31_9BACL|nr:archaetidylserine decarboxylase [Paenibacillus woosongensis]GIP59081.1 phosphatidylserine decarboxylase proenzyme [Paenibacillus woosongensis]